MGLFVRVLQNFEIQAETVGLSGKLNSNIMLDRVNQILPEEHHIAYYKSVRDDHTGDSLSGLVKWLYRLQQQLLEKAKPARQDTVLPPAPHKSSKSMNVASVDRNNYTRKSGQLRCALRTNASSNYLKNCNKFRALTLKGKYEVMKVNGICFRCGHNNCNSGKPTYNHNSCQFVFPCHVQRWGSDKHFSSICPVVYEGARGPSPSSTTTSHSNSNMEPRLAGSTATVSTVTLRSDFKAPYLLLWDICGGTIRDIQYVFCWIAGSKPHYCEKASFPEWPIVTLTWTT